MKKQTAEQERNTFIEQNLGLVHLLAGRFKGRGMEYDDLFQAGCVGLCKAADRFEPDRGLAFSTYAVPVILGEIKRLFREGGSVKVSRGLKETGMKLRRVQQTLEGKLGRSATIGELARAAGLSEEETAEAVMASKCPVSLSEPNEDGTVRELPSRSREAEVTARLSLETELSRLEPRDRELIRLRYYGGMTQSDTASRLGMTQVQVSRREKKLLLLLREALTG